MLDAAELREGQVLFHNPQKGFGFLGGDGYVEDVYASAWLLLRAGAQDLVGGEQVRVLEHDPLAWNREIPVSAGS